MKLLKKAPGLEVKRCFVVSRKHGFKRPHIRAAKAVPGILNTCVDVIQDEKYLLPIVFEGNTGTRGRWRLKSKMKGDIDDGCMRSIALAVAGRTKIHVYFGVAKS